MPFVTTATAMTPLVYLHLVYVETWFCLQISQFEFCALKNLHCGQVMKKKLEEKFSKKKIQGGQCPKIYGEDNVRKIGWGG